jgi:RHS repeat-associated protein
MLLKVPERLRERMARSMSAGVRSGSLVIGAFGAGVVVSLLESACTGQVYFPVIAGLVRDPGTRGDGAGIDTAATLVLLDTADVTAAAGATANGFSFTSDLVEGSHTLVVQIADMAGNEAFASSTFQISSLLPPDPASVAPPNDPTVPTDILASTAFLYTGDDPIQEGVAPGTIEPERVVILRGRVISRDGTPVTGVEVTILGHPEYGSTLSRADGWFDMAANGGGALTVSYVKESLLPVQRTVEVPWRDYVVVPDVIMIGRDPVLTAVDLGDPEYGVARGSVVTDDDGSRQATVMFPPGTGASIILPNGTQQPITTMTFRATEYTVGETGPEAMPAELPPPTGYTYCVEISADEAVANGVKVGGKDVLFTQPLPFYVDNFLDFPVGTQVPTAYYDNDQAVWVPVDDGLVIEILGEVDGLVNVDTDGDGQADDQVTLDGLGITEGERTKLAELYAAGDSLWRVPISHFSTYDCNWSQTVSVVPDSEPNVGTPSLPENECDKECGSIIEVQNQIVREGIPIAGSSFALGYANRSVRGFAASRSMRIPVSGGSWQATPKRVVVEVSVCGQTHKQVFPSPTPDLLHSHVWDGKDAYGRPVVGSATAHVRIGYCYDVSYLTPSSIPRTFAVPGGLPIRPGRVEGVVWRVTECQLEALRSKEVGIAGWDLSIHHSYDPSTGVISAGDGSRRASFDGKIEEYVLPNTNVLRAPANVGTYSDGHFIVAGRPLAYWCKPGQPGQVLNIGTEDREGISVAQDGTRWSWGWAAINPFTKMFRVSTFGPSGFESPTWMWFMNYVKDWMHPRAFDCGAAGNGHAYSLRANDREGKGGGYLLKVNRAKEVSYVSPPMVVRDITVGHDDILYIVDDKGRIWGREDGAFTQLAEVTGTLLPGLEVKEAAIAAHRDGTLYVGVRIGSDQQPYVSCSLHRVSDGKAVKIAGGDCVSAGNGGPIGAATFRSIHDMAVFPDGSLVLTDELPDPMFSDRFSVRLLSFGPRPAEGYSVPAKDATAAVHVFDYEGRHLRTVDALSDASRYVFGYDVDNGWLVSVTDGDGNVTTIQRDADGKPTSIVAPFGQVTQLTVNADGYLSSMTNPAGETTSFSYADGGLLTAVTNPMGASKTWGYDGLGRLAWREDADEVRTEYSREDASSGFSLERMKGVSRRAYQCGFDGRAISRMAADGGLTLFERDFRGRPVKVVTPRQFHILRIYNVLGKVTSEVGPFDPAEDPPPAVQNEYDGDGNLIKTIDENGIETTYTYVADRLASVTTAAGTTTYTYDFMNRKTEEKDPSGAFTKWHYNARGLLTQVSGSTAGGGGCASNCGQAAGAGGQLGWYSYDDDGLLVSFEDMNHHVWTYGYDAAGRRTSETDPLGYVTTYVYDTAGRLTSVTDANEKETAYTYTPAGRTLCVTNGAGDAVTYGYDASGRQTTVTDAEGGTRTTVYDSMGRVAEVRDALERKTSYTYDAEGNMTSMTDAAGVVTTYEHDAKGNALGASGAGPETVSEYGPGGRLVKTIVDPDGFAITTDYTYYDTGSIHTVTTYPTPTTTSVTTYEYDAVGRQISVTDGAGRTRLTTYNNAGWVTQVNDGETVTDYFYDEVGNRARVEVSGRAPVYYFYDNANRPTGTEQTDGSDPLNPVMIETHRALDGVGNVLSSTDGEGKVTTYEYDGARRLTDVTNPEDETTTYAYDGAGRRTSVTFANGSSRAYEYDKAGQLVETSGGPEGTLTYAYDALGRQTSVTDANGRSRETDYDALGRVTEVRNEMGQPVTYAYDILGRRTSLTDANGNTTLYQYDNDSRLVSMTYPEVAGEPANVETYSYDAGGLLTSKVTPNGDTIGYGYDGAGRLASVTFGGRAVAYTRDVAGAVTSIGGTGDVTTIGYGYDLLGQMTSSSDLALGKTIAYTNDKRGLRTDLTLDGKTVSYGYDDAGRLETVQKNGEASAATYAYDEGGRRESLSLPNGVSTTYGYDTSDRLLSLTTTGPAGTLASFTYTLDDTGNRMGIAYADGSKSIYGYDNAYRLTSETRTAADGTTAAYEITYQYDAVGNRIRMTSTGSAKAYRADSDTSGLWHMDEAVEEGAITAVDSSAHGNDLVGGFTLESVDGRLGKAVRFTGGGALSCADSAFLELGTDDFTLEVWVLPEALTGVCQLAAKWHPAADACSYRLYLNGGVPTFDLSTDGTSGTVHTLAGTEAVSVDEWAQIVASRSSGTVKLTVDGTEVASMPDPGAVTETSGTSVKTYSYDPNGNVLTTVEEVMGIEIAREDMTYDELNRMLTHSGPGGEETFTYRGAEWHRASANGKQFLYDGDNVLADIAGGATSAFYVTPFLDQNLSITTGGSTYYYSQDGLGSVRTLSDSSGDVKNTYDFLPFGGAYQPGTSVTVEQRYTYTGREKNPESALMYYRYRQYDPRVGRFRARDPIGYVADVNVYSYLGGSPVRSGDPLGLFGGGWGYGGYLEQERNRQEAARQRERQAARSRHKNFARQLKKAACVLDCLGFKATAEFISAHADDERRFVETSTPSGAAVALVFDPPAYTDMATRQVRVNTSGQTNYTLPWLVGHEVYEHAGQVGGLFGHWGHTERPARHSLPPSYMQSRPYYLGPEHYENMGGTYVPATLGFDDKYEKACNITKHGCCQKSGAGTWEWRDNQAQQSVMSNYCLCICQAWPGSATP